MASPISREVRKNSKEVVAVALRDLPSEQARKPTDEQYPTEAKRNIYENEFFGISNLQRHSSQRAANVMRKSISNANESSASVLREFASRYL